MFLTKENFLIIIQTCILICQRHWLRSGPLDKSWRKGLMSPASDRRARSRDYSLPLAVDETGLFHHCSSASL